LAQVLTFYPHQKQKLIQLAEHGIALDLLRTMIKSKSDTFFAQFSPELNDLLVQKFKVQTLGRGETFYSVGEYFPTCYIFIGKGQLRVIKGDQYIRTYKSGEVYAEDFLKILIKRYKATKSDTEDEGWGFKTKNDNSVTLESDTKNTIILYLLLSDFVNTLALFSTEQRKFFTNLDIIISKPTATSLEMMEHIHMPKQVSHFLTVDTQTHKEKEKPGDKWVTTLKKLVKSLPSLNHLSPDEKNQVKESTIKLLTWAKKKGIID